MNKKEYTKAYIEHYKDKIDDIFSFSNDIKITVASIHAYFSLMIDEIDTTFIEEDK